MDNLQINMSSKYERKRKRDVDTTKAGDEQEERKRRQRSRSRSPKKSSPKKHNKPQFDEDGEEGGDKNEGSLSIEETNKLRAKLGLAPLEIEDKTNTEPVEKDDGSGEKVFTEYGIEIVHKPSRNWAEEKRQKEIKEKLELKKKQRDVYSKVLKAKRGLAEEDSDEEGGTAKWVEKNRRMEEEERKARERAKQLDEMDEAFGVGGMIQQAEQQQRRRTGGKQDQSLTGGLMVGHSLQQFSEGRETVLVLQDKSLLDDEAEEVLINPNLVENERHKLMVERRKKKATHYQAYDEEQIDEFGQIKRAEILSKYDDGPDGDAQKRETFRLDSTGQYDLDKEAQEAEAKHRLMMMNKKFESLESTKYSLANEFYTEEEIIQFRRPKKGAKGGKNARKKKRGGEAALKADDLEPEPMEETAEERKKREAKLAARRVERGEEDGGNGDGMRKFKEAMKEGEMTKEEMEEGELEDEAAAAAKEAKSKELTAPAPGKEKWKKPKANVNVKMLQSLAEKMKKKEEEEESDEEEDDLPHATNVAPIRIDDEAEDELNEVLSKARRLRQVELMMKGGGERARMPAIREEDEESSDEEGAAMGRTGAIIFDATSEKYKSIGSGGYGGGRSAKVKPEVKMEADEEEEEEMDEEKILEILKQASTKKRKRGGSDKDSDTSDLERMEEDREGGSQRRRSEMSSDDDDDDLPTSTDILGGERDVTKGVGAMLKLAGEKGYLGGDRRRVGEGSLKHLESKRYSRVEQGRLDIEDKTMRKLERMGTTGTGPTRPFPEKPDYQPKIAITYSDKSGRVLEPKEAFRELSWKFHGKGPGKKQAEKHNMKVVKRETLKKMNSQDTPLGTLNKQLKKQEQLQAPYLVLTGRADAAPLQKE